jgi:hypothetical protein
LFVDNLKLETIVEVSIVAIDILLREGEIAIGENNFNFL